MIEVGSCPADIASATQQNSLEFCQVTDMSRPEQPVREQKVTCGLVGVGALFVQSAVAVVPGHEEVTDEQH